MKLRKSGLLVLLTVLGVGSANAAVIYGSRAAFDGAVGTSLTDDYQAAGYTGFIGDSAMSAVLGETDYRTTGFTDIMYGDDVACGGCNGSWEMSFTTTSIGSTTGVYGAAFDYANSNALPYVAFVTFGDNSTAEYALSSAPTAFPTTPFFFGITSDTLIKSIHLGLTAGGATTDGYFYADNLTISARSGSVPVPASLALLALGLAGIRYSRTKTN